MSQPSANGIAKLSPTQRKNSLSTTRRTRSLSRSGANRSRSAVPTASNSQPTCACHSPLTPPQNPGPARCGECGSPAWSVNVWCLRWSATQVMTDPCTAIEPSMATIARNARLDSNARWVNMRW